MDKTETIDRRDATSGFLGVYGPREQTSRLRQVVCPRLPNPLEFLEAGSEPTLVKNVGDKKVDKIKPSFSMGAAQSKLCVTRPTCQVQVSSCLAEAIYCGGELESCHNYDICQSCGNCSLSEIECACDLCVNEADEREEACSSCDSHESYKLIRFPDGTSESVRWCHKCKSYWCNCALVDCEICGVASNTFVCDSCESNPDLDFVKSLIFMTTSEIIAKHSALLERNKIRPEREAVIKFLHQNHLSNLFRRREEKIRKRNGIEMIEFKSHETQFPTHSELEKQFRKMNKKKRNVMESVAEQLIGEVREKTEFKAPFHQWNDAFKTERASAYKRYTKMVAHNYKLTPAEAAQVVKPVLKIKQKLDRIPDEHQKFDPRDFIDRATKALDVSKIQNKFNELAHERRKFFLGEIVRVARDSWRETVETHLPYQILWLIDAFKKHRVRSSLYKFRKTLHFEVVATSGVQPKPTLMQSQLGIDPNQLGNVMRGIEEASSSIAASSSQMLVATSKISSCATEATNTFTSVNECLEGIKNGAKSFFEGAGKTSDVFFGQLGKQVGEISDRMKGLGAEKSTLGFIVKVIEKVLCVINGVYVVYKLEGFVDKFCGVQLLASSLGLGLLSVGSALVAQIKRIVDCIRKVKEAEFQAKEDAKAEPVAMGATAARAETEAEKEASHSLIRESVSLIGSVFKDMFVGLDAEGEKLFTARTIKLQKLATNFRSFDSMATIADKFVNWIIKTIEKISIRLGGEPDRIENEMQVLIDAWCKLRGNPKFLIEFKSSAGIAYELDRIWKESLRELTRAQRKVAGRQNSEYAGYLLFVERFHREVDAFRKLVPAHMLSVSGERKPPFVLHLVGNPGIGKSAVLKFVNCGFMKTLGIDLGSENPSGLAAKYTYVRIPNDKFWSGYTNQPITIFDDFGQITDDQALVEEASALIACCNGVQLPLNMAACDDKGMVYFTSPVVCITSNNHIGPPMVNKVASSKALKRRRNVLVEVILKPEYCISAEDKRISPGPKNSTKGYIGDNKLMPDDLYKFQIVDVFDQQRVIQTFESLVGLQQYLCDSLLAHMSGADNLTDCVNSFVRSGMKLHGCPGQQPTVEERWRALENVAERVAQNAAIATSGRGKPGYVDWKPEDPEMDLGEEVPRNDPRPPVWSFLSEPKLPTEEESRIIIRQRNEKRWRGYHPYAQQEVEERVKQTGCGWRDEGPNAPCVLEHPCACRGDWSVHVAHGRSALQFKLQFTNTGFRDEIVRWLKGRLYTMSEVNTTRAILKFCSTYPEVIHPATKISQIFPKLQAHFDKTFPELLNIVDPDFRSEIEDDDDDSFYSLDPSLSSNISSHLENLRVSFSNCINSIKCKLSDSFLYKLYTFVKSHFWPIVVGFFTVITSSIVMFIVYSCLKKEKPVVESHNNYDKVNEKAKSAPVRRIGAKQASKIAAASQSAVEEKSACEQVVALAGNEDVEQLLRMATATLYAENEQGIRRVQAICVAGDVFLVPFHFTFGLVGSSVRLRWRDQPEVCIPGASIFVYYPGEVRERDFVFIQLRNAVCGKDLSKHFVASGNDFSLNGAYLFGYDVTRKTSEKLTPSVVKRLEAKQTYRDGGVELSVQKGFSCFGVSAERGDCGTALLSRDPRFPRILGIITAGVMKSSVSFVQSIFQEDVLDGLDHFKAIRVPIPKGVKIGDVEASSLTELAGLNTLGKLRGRKVTLATKTCWSESPLSEKMSEVYGPSTLMPAQLKVRDGVSPMYNGLKKFRCMSGMIDPEVVERATADIVDGLREYPTEHSTNPRILTDEEMYNGVFDDLQKIDLTTSPGYPFTLEVQGVPGKKSFFEVKDEKILPGERVAEAVRQRIERAKLGEGVETYFVDTLKDEKRPIEKVLAAKTRIFNVGPMDLTLVFRKYFGSLVMHMKRTSLVGECSVGVNPRSRDWDFVIRRLLAKSDKFLNGDYSNFDASLPFQLGVEVAEIANRFYNDGEENATVRRVLMNTVFSSDHIANDHVHCFRQGNPSGIAVTVIVNCLVNMLLVRCAFEQLCGIPANKFREYMDHVCYGDDNIVAVSPVARKNFTMRTYAEWCEEIGITYTSVTKGAIEQDFVELEDLSYLKRDFFYRDDLGLYVARGDQSLIREPPRWISRKGFESEDVAANLCEMLRESALYGKVAFLKTQKEIRDLIAEANRDGFVIPSSGLKGYNEIIREMFGDECVNSTMVTHCGLFDALLSDAVGISGLACSGRGQFDDAVATSGKMVTDNTISESGLLGDGENANQNTDFADNVETHKTEMQDYSTVKLPLNMPEVHLDAVLFRPFLLGTKSWSSTDGIGVNLFDLQFPRDFINITTVKKKLANFAFWAPKFKIIVKINGTFMHYGRLIMWWIPYDAYRKDGRYNVTTAQWAQIDANSTQGTEFEIPFVYHRNVITKDVGELSLVKIQVQCPLQSASSKATPVNVTAYVQLVEHNLEGYVAEALSGKSSSVRPGAGSETVKKTTQGTIGKVLGKVSAVGQGLSFIPEVGPIAGAIGAVADVAGSICDFFGWSIPPNVANTNPMQISNPLLCRSVDNPLTRIMCHNPTAQLEVNSEYMAEDISHMNYNTFLSRMCILEQFKISQGDASGKQVFGVPITPTFFRTTLEGNHSGNTLLRELSLLHGMWRGSIRVHVAFVCSKMHSCRVRFWYNPYQGSTNPVNGNISDVMNIVMDIADNTDYSFTIPYKQQTDWLNVTGTDGYNSTNGYMGMTVLNPLTSGTDIVNPITVQIFVSAGPDFQFNIPRFTGEEFGFNGDEAVATSGLTRPQDACEIPSLSMKCLGESDYPVIGTAGMHVSEGVSTTSNVYSFKQMVSMLSPIGPVTVTGLNELRLITNPWVGAPTDLQFWNYWLRVGKYFAFWKGGVRFVLLPMEPANNGIASVRVNFQTDSVSDVVSTVVRAPLELRDWTQSVFMSSNVTLNPIDFVIPYDHVFKMLPTKQNNTYLFRNRSNVAYFQYDKGAEGASKFMLFAAGADDFQYSYQLPLHFF